MFKNGEIFKYFRISRKLEAYFKKSFLAIYIFFLFKETNERLRIIANYIFSDLEFFLVV